MIRELKREIVSTKGKSTDFKGYFLRPRVLSAIAKNRVISEALDGMCYVSSTRYSEVVSKDDGTEVVKDSGFDWFHAVKYDLIPRPEDPLTDLVLLQRSFVESLSLTKQTEQVLSYSFIRDEEDPDIVITLSKNANQTITTTYVPPSYTVVNTGSFTTPKYSFLKDKFLGYETQQANQIIKSGDYNVTTVNAAVFLEISVLDAKKMLLESQKYPPVIWKGSFENYYDRAIKKEEVIREKAGSLAKRFSVRPPLVKTVVSILFTGMEVEWGVEKEKKGKKKGDAVYYVIKEIAQEHPLYGLGARKGDVRRGDTLYRNGEVVLEKINENDWNWKTEVVAINYGIKTN